jgi:protein-tyrosine phosphatase
MVPGTTLMPSTILIKKKVASLNHIISAECPDFYIVPGMEIALDLQIPDLLDKNRLLPIGTSSYLLIETPFQQLPSGWEHIFFSIMAKGYSILLAHPERCHQLMSTPKMIDRLVESGIYLQVNWGSFFGQYGKSVSRAAQHLAKISYIHCIASDSHNSKTQNPAVIEKETTQLQNLIGLKNLKRITQDNPRKVLQSKVLKPMEKMLTHRSDRKIKKRRFLWN